MSQQPPYGENPYGPSAYGNPQYGSSPYGTPPDYPTAQYGAPPPQPPKKKAGLIIFLVVGALLIAGGVLATVLILASRDDDDKAQEGSDDPTSSESENAPDDGPGVDGAGYTYALPEDWNDVTEDALSGDVPGTVDTVSAWGKKLTGGRANVIVETGSAGSTEDEEDLREDWETNMASSSGVTPEEIDGTEIDGEDAIGAKMEQTTDSGVDIVQIAYLVIVDGTQYSIGLSAKQGDDDAQDRFEEILGSWSWE
ncbi:hypothetical protein [Nocardioides speluncae]|uniref:hypothetical protein n=1 Tax=Nocardioides speluncae TaxID=2670337 RepID=UPI000D68AA60|nr:hypothetical protein [Nocardioides speluncae]